MKKLFAMTVAVLLLFSVLLGIPAAYGQAPETGKTLDILFSHDTHSHLNTFTARYPGISFCPRGWSRKLHRQCASFW